VRANASVAFATGRSRVWLRFHDTVVELDSRFVGGRSGYRRCRVIARRQGLTTELLADKRSAQWRPETVDEIYRARLEPERRGLNKCRQYRDAIMRVDQQAWRLIECAKFAASDPAVLSASLCMLERLKPGVMRHETEAAELRLSSNQAFASIADQRPQCVTTHNPGRHQLHCCPP